MTITVAPPSTCIALLLFRTCLARYHTHRNVSLPFLISILLIELIIYELLFTAVKARGLKVT